SGQKTEVKLAPELEAIATTACEQLRAKADGDPQREEQLQRGVGEAAGRAIAAGLSLTAIADAERIGHARARGKLGTEVLRVAERAAQRSARPSAPMSKRSVAPLASAWCNATSLRRHMSGTARSGRCSRAHSQLWQIAPPRRSSGRPTTAMQSSSPQ
ncbi:MAG: hypothetical protein ACXVII_46140, partial [Solirubrobacteraceae bacterium]